LTVMGGVVALGADSLVAVIVAVPTPTAVTVVVPLVELAGLTVSTAGSLETQLTVLAVKVTPAASVVVAVSDCVSPTTIGVVGAETVTVATGASVTVIEAVPILVSLVAVMVTGPPADSAVTRPAWLTVATPSLSDDQVITRLVSSLLAASRRLAVSCCVAPTTRLALAGLTVTVATGTGLTMISGVVALTDSLVAVIVAVPTPVAVTVMVAPLAALTELVELTVSTAVLLETQFTVRPDSAVPLASLGVAVRTCVPPTNIGLVGDDSVTVATGAGVTVIDDVPLCPSLAAVIVADPAATAVTRPV